VRLGIHVNNMKWKLGVVSILVLVASFSGCVGTDLIATPSPTPTPTTTPTPSPTVTSTPTPTPTPTLDHIIISEVFYDTPGIDANEEFIELYNPTLVDVDLSEWTLSDNYGSYKIPNESIIKSKGNFVVARNGTGFEILFGFEPDVSGLTLRLNNDGDQVYLNDTNGVEIDFVAYGGYVSGWNITTLVNESIQRISLEVDTDSVSDWIAQPPSPG